MDEDEAGHGENRQGDAWRSPIVVPLALHDPFPHPREDLNHWAVVDGQPMRVNSAPRLARVNAT